MVSFQASYSKCYQRRMLEPLHVAHTNYAELVEINMLDMVEYEGEEAKRVEGSNMNGKQATEGLTNIIPFDTPGENIFAGDAESEATEGPERGIT